MAKWLGWIGLCGLLGGIALGFGARAVVAQETPAAAAPKSETETQVIMNGDSFKTDMKNGTYTWIGNARFIRGSDSVFSDELTLYMTPDRQVKQASAKGNVRILTQEVTAAGDQGTFYLDEQKVELEGHAKASQGNNSITAHRIVAWLEGNAVEGYGSRETERVIMTIYSEPVAQPAAETPETAAAPENEPEIPSQPSLIVIESDTLQYHSAQAYAMFTGAVNAQQNNMVIQADDMRVYLATDDNAGADTGRDIDRIEVAGNVRIVQDAIVITGTAGVFDESNQSAVITGTPEQQARAENSAEKSILNADSITMMLASEDIQAEGNVSFETVMSEPAEANP